MDDKTLLKEIFFASNIELNLCMVIEFVFYPRNRWRIKVSRIAVN